MKPVSPLSHQAKQRAWVMLFICIALCVAGGLILIRGSKTGYSVWNELSYRTRGEWARYALECLEDHAILKRMAQPLRSTLQRQIERPEIISLSLIDTLSKGQQLHSLPPQTFAPDGIPQAVDLLKRTRGGAWVAASRANAGDPHGVRDAKELKAAIALAHAGETITLLPGIYRLSGWLQPKFDGTAINPITVRADEPGTVVIKIESGTIHQDRAFWIYENLVIEGHCGGQDLACEHAFHVVGGGRHVVIRNNLIRNFGAHIKVNGEGGLFPDGGLLQFNTLTNDKAYDYVSLTPFDLVGASHWIVADNHVSHFVKHWDKNASYGVFMKGGGEGGRIERNIVVCTTDGDISHYGSRVGISLGGGLTGKSFCPDKECIYEHKGGVVINNIVMNCNDFGIDNNRAIQSVIAHNTVINTYGIGIRGVPSDADVYGNVVDGAINARRGGTLNSLHNLQRNALDGLQAPFLLDFAWRNAPDVVPTHPKVSDDFCGIQRAASSLPGAFSHANACKDLATAPHQ